MDSLLTVIAPNKYLKWHKNGIAFPIISPLPVFTPEGTIG